MDRLWVVLVIAIGAVLYKTYNADSSVDPLVVQTSYGPIKGRSFVSPWTNQTIYAFQGIPYAAPPVGDLRYKDPESPTKWNSLKECTKDQPSCPQPDDPILKQLNLMFDTSEDCLYINVFTPELKPENPLPVMVYIHGGAFRVGSGCQSLNGPDFLVGEGVIIVTLTYRLGALGFLTLGTPEIPGNTGLRDQRFALQWVQKEINQFGGDPGQVTIFGESAGGASVHFHYLSPLSKGLFNRAIAASGTAMGWALREDSGPKYGLRFASALNCSTEDLSITHKCMLAASTEDILKAQGLVKCDDDDAKDTLGMVFVPNVDKNSSSEPFVPDHPRNLIKQNIGSSVPFMMGFNTEEGIVVQNLIQEDITTMTLEKFLPMEKRKNSPPSAIQILFERIKKVYFYKANTYADRFRGYVRLLTDYLFGYHIAESAREYRNRNNVYVYTFGFDGKFKELQSIAIEEKFNITGVTHAEDLNYLFVVDKVNQTAAADSREMLAVKRMVRLWTNFGKFGSPTVEPDPILQNLSWTPFSEDSPLFLSIEDNLSMETEEFLVPRFEFWNSVPSNSE